MSRIVRLAVGFLLAALALGACGEGGVSGAQKEQAERADDICIDLQEKVGRELGDEPEADRDAVRAASDQFMAMNVPSEGETTWEIFIQSTNNLWISLQDIAQSLDPNVNDRARAERARETVDQVHENIRNAADDYGMEVCSEGFTLGSRNRD